MSLVLCSPVIWVILQLPEVSLVKATSGCQGNNAKGGGFILLGWDDDRSLSLAYFLKKRNKQFMQKHVLLEAILMLCSAI